MESDYDSPYNLRDGGADERERLNKQEMPATCLARNPSGSLYIPSGKVKY
jgi:hypothetical protein